jgi:CheY-like chemotaxis protein
LALFLDAKGYAVHGAVDGADALLLLATGLRPCCMSPMWRCPTMDGWALTDASARTRGSRPCLPLYHALTTRLHMRSL